MSFLRRITNLITRTRLDREIDAELSSHIEMRTADNIADGMSKEDAQRDAMLRFGNPAVMKERVAGADAALSLDGLLRDLRLALRSCLRSPAFAVTAVAHARPRHWRKCRGLRCPEFPHPAPAPCSGRRADIQRGAETARLRQPFLPRLRGFSQSQPHLQRPGRIQAADASFNSGGTARNPGSTRSQEISFQCSACIRNWDGFFLPTMNTDPTLPPIWC